MSPNVGRSRTVWRGASPVRTRSAASSRGRNHPPAAASTAGALVTKAAQALEKRTMGQTKEIDALRAENTELKARLEALERMFASFALTKAE